LGLTKNEAIILGVLMKKEIAHKEAIWLTIYAAKAEEDEAEQKIIDVWVCKMRPKLKRFDVEIQTAWGVGYFLRPEDKAKVISMLSEA
jgi:two-component system cell cycle response regulator CtrA